VSAEGLNELKWLIGVAKAAGADAARLGEASNVLFNGIMDLEEFKSGYRDPRRQRTLEFAKCVQRAHSSGMSIPELRERFQKSRAQIYRYLSLITSRDTFAL
jgi:hypothetical protein